MGQSEEKIQGIQFTAALRIRLLSVTVFCADSITSLRSEICQSDFEVLGVLFMEKKTLCGVSTRQRNERDKSLWATVQSEQEKWGGGVLMVRKVSLWVEGCWFKPLTVRVNLGDESEENCSSTTEGPWARSLTQIAPVELTPLFHQKISRPAQFFFVVVFFKSWFAQKCLMTPFQRPAGKAARLWNLCEASY